MSDSDLTNYIPFHGDRLRVRAYLQKEKLPNKRRDKLLNVLQEKLEKARMKRGTDQTGEDTMRNPHRPFGNRNATKMKRVIEIGWIHKNTHRSTQVRKNKGGGTRKLEVLKTATKTEILEQAISLFFPNGMSSKGPVTEFNFDLWDFADRTIGPDVTVANMYETTKMPVLRFYLSTTYRNNPENISNEPKLRHSPEKHNTTQSQLSQDLTVLQHDKQDDKEDNNFTDRDILHHAMEISGLPISDDDSLPSLTDHHTEVSTNSKHISLTLHRGHLLKELIEAFKNINPSENTVSVQMVMPDGGLEAAEDGGGVTRDALSDFWTNFYDQCTVGTKFKIPYLRHDFAECEWRSVANIIVFGWDSSRYFPIRLSQPFLQLCLFGKVSDNIMEAFFDIIPNDEVTTFRNALSNWESVDYDDLIEVLELHECKIRPTSQNISKILNEIAHKEIIQTPMFIVDCFQPILKQIDISEENLIQLYADLIPKPKIVNRILKFPESMCAEEQAVANHLRRFIRELNDGMLGKFIRFCTGSDLIVCKEIKVSFVNTSGLARRPIAHTCSCLLELSKSYESFPQFRSEFLAVLESNVWVMDII
jgi:hypothetical protein